MTEGPKLFVWNCPYCGRMQERVRLMPGSTLEIKCEKCGHIIMVSIRSVDSAGNNLVALNGR